MVIEPQSFDFFSRTPVMSCEGQKEATLLSSGILKPTPQRQLTVGVGNILISVSHVSTYIMEGHMGGGNVLTWEVVSQTLFVLTLIDETHFLNK